MAKKKNLLEDMEEDFELVGHSGYDSKLMRVDVTGEQYVAGLVWLPLDALSLKQGKKEAKLRAKDLSMNLMALHSSSLSGIEAINVGLGSVAKESVKSYVKSVPLALALAKEVEQEGAWLGIFEYEMGAFCLVGVQDGLVIPGFDATGDIENANSWLTEHLLERDWNRVFLSNERLLSKASELVEGVDFDESTLSDLLLESSVTKTEYIQAVSGSISKATSYAVAATVVLVGVAVAGGLVYQSINNAKRAELLRKANLVSAQKLEQARQAARARVLAAAPKPSWLEDIASVSWLNNCYKSINNLPYSLAGWQLVKVTCSDGKTVGEFERKMRSTMQDFWTSAQELKASGEAIEFDLTPDTAKITMNWDSISFRAKSSSFPAPEKDFWLRQWVSAFQIRDIESKIEPYPEPAPGPVDDEAVDLLGIEGATPPAPDWERYSWEIKSDNSSIFGLLVELDLSATTIKSLNADVSRGLKSNWLISGQSFVTK